MQVRTEYKIDHQYTVLKLVLVVGLPQFYVTMNSNMDLREIHEVEVKKVKFGTGISDTHNRQKEEMR